MSQKFNENHWKELAEKELKDRKLNDLGFDTPEGIRIKALYTDKDILNLNHKIQHDFHIHLPEKKKQYL